MLGYFQVTFVKLYYNTFDLGFCVRIVRCGRAVFPLLLLQLDTMILRNMKSAIFMRSAPQNMYLKKV